MFARFTGKAAAVVASLVLVGWASGAAMAQVGTGTLVGTVKDAASQKAVADVVVTVSSPALQGEEIAVTGKNGDFRIGGLPPGEYEIRMDKESYRPYARGGVRVRADVTLRVDTQLLPEDLKEDIVVIARAPTVDVGSTQTGATIDKEFTRRVPAMRPGGKGSDTRNIEAAASSVPQAKSDEFGTSVNGTTSPENNYVIDGLSVGDPAYGTLGTPMNMEFVEELNVITGGYMPEYGKSTGGILNAISKSGSDEFELSIWGFFSPSALNGTPKEVRGEGDSIDVQEEIGNIYDFGFSIGGPIVKETLWYYIGVDYAHLNWDITRNIRAIVYDPTTFEPVINAETGLTETILVPGNTEEFIAEQNTLQVFGKLSYRLDKSNRLSLTLLGAPSWSGGPGEYGIDPRDGSGDLPAFPGPVDSNAHTYDALSFDAMLKWNADIVDDKLLLETSVGWHHQNNTRLANDGSEIGSDDGLAGQPSIIFRRGAPHDIRDFEDIQNGSMCDAPAGAPEGTVPCPVLLYGMGGPDFQADESLERVGLRTVLSWLPEGAGTHVLKLGAELDYLIYDTKTAYSGRTRYRESVGGGRFDDNREYGFLQGTNDEIILANAGSITDSISLGFFLQDSWTFVKGLTANIGLRWDSQWLQNHDGDTVIALANEWSPRIGLVWDPTTDGGAKIYANIALFYESIPLDLANRAGSGDPQIFSSHASAACDPTDPAQTAEGGACKVDENRFEHLLTGLDAPDRYWYITGGGRTPVDPDLQAQSSWELVAGAEYDFGRLTNVLKDVRGGLLYTKRWMNNVIEDMSRDEAQTYFIGNPGSGIAKDFPKAERDYDAITVYLMKEFSDCWLLQGSYTLSWLEGNYAGLFRPETLQLDPNINADFDLKSLTVNRYGPLPGDTRHAFKLFGAHDIEVAKGHHIQPGYGLRLTSGGPTSFLAGHPVYGADEVFVLPRGAGPRLPWVASIDLHVGYEVDFGDDFKLGFSVEVYNLFNFQAPTAKSNRYSSDDIDPIRGGTPADLEGLLNREGEPVTVNPNFQNTTSYQRPRTFRFGVRGNF